MSGAQLPESLRQEDALLMLQALRIDAAYEPVSIVPNIAWMWQPEA
jgi:hypothetical protein